MSRRELAAAGVTDDELRRMRRRGELATIRPGVYLDPADPRLGRPERRHLLQVAAAVPRIAADAVISHQSAAVLYGLPVWNLELARVHVTRPRRTGALHSGRLVVHASPLEADEVGMVDGVAVTSVARTLVDVARAVGFEEAVAVLDAALHRHVVERASLVIALDRARRWPGTPKARRAVALRRPAADERRRVPQPGRDGPARRRRACAAVGGRRDGRPCARHGRLRLARTGDRRGVRRVRQVRQVAASRPSASRRRVRREAA